MDTPACFSTLAGAPRRQCLQFTGRAICPTLGAPPPQNARGPEPSAPPPPQHKAATARAASRGAAPRCDAAQHEQTPRRRPPRQALCNGARHAAQTSSMEQGKPQAAHGEPSSSVRSSAARRPGPRATSPSAAAAWASCRTHMRRPSAKFRAEYKPRLASGGSAARVSA